MALTPFRAGVSFGPGEIAASLADLSPFDRMRTLLPEHPLDEAAGSIRDFFASSPLNSPERLFGRLAQHGIEGWFLNAADPSNMIGVGAGATEKPLACAPLFVFIIIAGVAHLLGFLGLHYAVTSHDAANSVDPLTGRARWTSDKIALIEQARAALADPSTADYSRFLASVDGMKMGYSASELAAMEAEWDKSIRSYTDELAGEKDQRKKAYGLMEKLYWDYYKRYAR